jgi:hypothetical protein
MKKFLGILLVIISLIVLYAYIETSAFIIAVVSAVIGMIGILFLYQSGRIEVESTILSILTMGIGGFLVPLLPILENFAKPLIIIAYGVATLLLILKPPERWYTEATVQN